MNHTVTRADMAAAFRLAKDHIDSLRYICIALSAVKNASPHRKYAVDACKKLVRQRLRGHYELWSWIVIRGHATNEEYDADRLLVTRHAWLDSLIEEFSE